MLSCVCVVLSLCCVVVSCFILKVLSSLVLLLVLLPVPNYPDVFHLCLVSPMCMYTLCSFLLLLVRLVLHTEPSQSPRPSLQVSTLLALPFLLLSLAPCSAVFSSIAE